MTNTKLVVSRTQPCIADVTLEEGSGGGVSGGGGGGLWWWW